MVRKSKDNGIASKGDKMTTNYEKIKNMIADERSLDFHGEHHNLLDILEAIIREDGRIIRLYNNGENYHDFLSNNQRIFLNRQDAEKTINVNLSHSKGFIDIASLTQQNKQMQEALEKIVDFVGKLQDIYKKMDKTEVCSSYILIEEITQQALEGVSTQTVDNKPQEKAFKVGNIKNIIKENLSFIKDAIYSGEYKTGYEEAYDDLLEKLEVDSQ